MYPNCPTRMDQQERVPESVMRIFGVLLLGMEGYLPWYQFQVQIERL